MRNAAIPAAVLVIVGSAMAGGLVGSQVTANEDRLQARYLMYTSALAAIEKDYVEPVESAPLIYGSVDGLLRTLDPHSSFLPPQAFEQMRERQEGRYFGIGISIVSANGDITVTQLFEGSPAYRAGIRRGDIIAMVEEDSTKGWDTRQVVDRVRGDKGTTIDISIKRPGLEELVPLTVERDEIHITTVRTAFMMTPETGYIRFQDFSETSNNEVGAALEKLSKAGMQQLILDLRDNPGGPLDQAIAVANRFLQRGQMIVYTRGRIANADVEYPAADQGGYTTQPLIVLVNRNSASASEIVSGAMQDHDRGLIVGETTFGKALVQSVYPVSNNAGLALTTGQYYTPAGRLIQRPWDGSFDEYLTYSLRDQNPDAARDPKDLVRTDAGREVYSGGGIQPDHFVAGPVEGFNPTRFSRLLMTRGAFIGFAEKFLREGDTRPASKTTAKFTVSEGWDVTDAMVDEFRAYLGGLGARMDEQAFTTDLAFIKAMIHFEVDNDLFSFEDARRNLSRVDPQVQAALGYFDEARRLMGSGRER
jgi:carboxyl-terminal processing protease